jgi:hypothetical protein
LGSAAGSDPTSRSRAEGKTNLAVVPPILPRLWHAANRDFDSFVVLLSAIARVTEGRLLPGYRWVPLTVRHLRRTRLRKLAIGSATAVAIALAIWFGAGWYAGLPANDPIRLCLTAIPSVSALFGLIWAIVLVVSGEKRTPWG